jgi:hypothetical protein
VSDLPEANPDVVAAAAPGGTTGHDEPVLVFDAATEEEADVVRATLTAAGIPATLLNSSLNAGAAFAEGVGDTWRNGVFVSPSNVEAARAVLNAPALSEVDLIAAEEADPTTLAEAEAQIKDA